MIHDLEEGGIDAQAFFLGRKEAILIYLKGEGGKGVGGRGGVFVCRYGAIKKGT